MILAHFRKQPREAKRLFIDYYQRLNVRVLVHIDFIKITPSDETPLLSVAAAIDTEQQRVNMMVFGGVDLTNYVVEIGVKTDTGEVWEDELSFYCEDIR